MVNRMRLGRTRSVGPRLVWALTIGALVAGCGTTPSSEVGSAPLTGPPGYNLFCSNLEVLKGIDPDWTSSETAELVRAVSNQGPAAVGEQLDQIASVIQARTASPDLPVDPTVVVPAASALADYVDRECTFAVPLFDELAATQLSDGTSGNPLPCLHLGALRTIATPTTEAADRLRATADYTPQQLRDPLQIMAGASDEKTDDLLAAVDQEAVTEAAAQLSAYTTDHCTFSVPMFDDPTPWTSIDGSRDGTSFCRNLADLRPYSAGPTAPQAESETRRLAQLAPPEIGGALNTLADEMRNAVRGPEVNQDAARAAAATLSAYTSQHCVFRVPLFDIFALNT